MKTHTSEDDQRIYERSSADKNLKCLLDILPLDTVEYACAYGSGAVPQEGDGTFGEMIDFIVATRDSNQFHKQNLKMNPKHYSSLRFLGYQKIVQVQRSCAARVYCNTRVLYRVWFGS